MKLTLLFVSLLVLTASVALTSSLARFNWRKMAHDFGTITRAKPVTAEFVFTNQGEAPLLISQAKGSCGCTGVEYPKGAVLPGQSGVIRATFNAAAVGAFNKSVTVESNAEGGTTVLSIRGEVVSEGTAGR